jgi:hypothetical protein
VLDLGEFLTDIRATLGGRVASALQKIQDAINQTNTVNGTDPTQHTDPPAAPNAINVSAGSDHVHVTLTDHTQRPRAQNYFVEWSANDPNFLAPHVEHFGASRGRVLALPAMDGDSNPISYYFRGFSGTLGAKTASPKIYFGSNMSPTPVTLSGSSTLDLLPSQGSGTAATNGQQGGQGFGDSQFSTPGASLPKAP